MEHVDGVHSRAEEPQASTVIIPDAIELDISSSSAPLSLDSAVSSSSSPSAASEQVSSNDSHHIEEKANEFEETQVEIDVSIQNVDAKNDDNINNIVVCSSIASEEENSINEPSHIQQDAPSIPPNQPEKEQNVPEPSVSVSVTASPPSPAPSSPPPSLLSTFLKKIDSIAPTTEDWWSMWLGMFLCAVAFGFAASNTSLPELLKWKGSPFDAYKNISSVGLLPLFFIIGIPFAISLYYLKRPAFAFVFHGGYLAVFVLALIAKTLSAQSALKQYGIGAAVWSVILGMVVTNVLCWKNKGLYAWLSSAAWSELYIKTSVVILCIDFNTLARLGPRGFLSSWVDTPLVLLFIYFLGTRVLKVEKHMCLVLAAATTVCGSSAASAIASAIQAPKQASVLSIAVMSLFTIPAIPLIPYIGQAMGLQQQVIGGWIGGSVDTTGAVIASAAIAGEEALKTAAVVKMIQNALIGFIALAVTIVWKDDKPIDPKAKKPSALQTIWERFPKFVLGFIATSIFLSVIIPEAQRANAANVTFFLSEWIATLGFVSIGLEMYIPKLITQLRGSNIIPLYCVGQLLDILVTLGMAQLSFATI